MNLVCWFVGLLMLGSVGLSGFEKIVIENELNDKIIRVQLKLKEGRATCEGEVGWIEILPQGSRTIYVGFGELRNSYHCPVGLQLVDERGKGYGTFEFIRLKGASDRTIRMVDGPGMYRDVVLKMKGRTIRELRMTVDRPYDGYLRG